ncbi:hypothetical protein FQN54_005890 [Arachnomyces sp. PD_36]|nr:hypothetical protein FQN54_005890 [Arachnomyces sp. PD_36]
MAFRQQCQERCRFHVDEIASLVKLGLVQGKQAFDDLHCLMAAYESVKIQIVHTSTATSNSAMDRMKAVENIRANMTALDWMHLKRDKPNPYHRRLLPLLTRFGFDEIVSEWWDLRASLSGAIDNDEIVGPPEAGYLSNAATFRIAKSVVQTGQRDLSKPSTCTSGVDSNNALLLPSGPPTITPVQSGAIVPDIAVPFTLQESVSTLPGGRDSEDIHSVSATVSLQDPEYIQLAEEMSAYITWDVFVPPT